MDEPKFEIEFFGVQLTEDHRREALPAVSTKGERRETKQQRARYGMRVSGRFTLALRAIENRARKAVARLKNREAEVRVVSIQEEA